jgi:hypothetical protein
MAGNVTYWAPLLQDSPRLSGTRCHVLGGSAEVISDLAKRLGFDALKIAFLKPDEVFETVKVLLKTAEIDKNNQKNFK